MRIMFLLLREGKEFNKRLQNHAHVARNKRSARTLRCFSLTGNALFNAR